MEVGIPVYRVFQANVMKKKLAMEELMIEAKTRKTTVALIQEPYVVAGRSARSYPGVRLYHNHASGEGTIKAMIAVFDAKIDVI